MGENLNIFAIYTVEDIAVMHKITQRLKSSGKDVISIWNDDPIKPGQVWKPQVESRLQEADIFLFFISNSFMHSEFVKQLEFKMVIDQYKEGKSKVIPILIDDCPWGIDFEADEYTFSFKELQVLPEEGKPIKMWDSSEEVYNDIARSINAMNESLFGNDRQEESKVDEEEEVEIVEAEEQIAISFDEEEAEEEKRRKEEAETKRIAEENQARKEAETKKKAEEEQRRIEEAVSKKRAAEQREREAADSRRLEEQKRFKKEAELKRQAEEKQRIEAENRQESATVANRINDETSQEKGWGLKKRFLIGLGVALLAIIGIWVFNRSPDEGEEPTVNTKAVEVEDSIPVEKTETEPIFEEEPLTELTIGDQYDGGIVFAIDSDGKTGKIVHIDDAGPMPWLDAMIIHDQLGKGWRLPTLDELKLLYSTLGQGASNSAEFADKLYWSSSPYDQYQARLLQFRTGNTSYHYNKEAEHRKFLVRAVRDFNR